MSKNIEFEVVEEVTVIEMKAVDGFLTNRDRDSFVFNIDYSVFTAGELRQIAIKLDELNGVSNV
jgi:hypothetical protein